MRSAPGTPAGEAGTGPGRWGAAGLQALPLHREHGPSVRSALRWSLHWPERADAHTAPMALLSPEPILPQRIPNKGRRLMAKLIAVLCPFCFYRGIK